MTENSELSPLISVRSDRK